MGKQNWKPGNMLYPIPAVLVSVADKNGRTNVFTASWVGTVCSDPPMVSVSVRPERYSYHMIEETGEFVVNLTTKRLTRAADYCGVRDENKWERAGLTPIKGTKVLAPCVKESPVNIECRVARKIALGTHDMFIGTVEAVLVDEAYMDEKNTFHLEKADPVIYSHGTYYGLGEAIGKFGFSVKRKR
jgi:flavin reductase (DIM6/NTAB) family NADH-FMN oxidoreductase RutF